MKLKNQTNNLSGKHRSLSARFYLAVTLLLLPVAGAIAQDQLNVIQGNASNNHWIYFRDAHNSLYHHLSSEAFRLLDQRREEVSKLRSRDDWVQRQAQVRRTINDLLGPFPERTPLNPQIMRIIDKDKFTVEHIIFESQPGFYVTSSLFLPRERQEPAPAILYLSGHAAVGYRSSIYLHKILNLVNKGFIVFAFDPVSQGERLEYFDPESGQSLVGRATLEHSYSNVQSYMAGSSLAMHMTWDGIRAIDYLVSREEVDPGRIGLTGRSGGGTQTAYIAAIDNRVAAIAPECWITTYQRVLQTIGPQDAEQNLYQGILRGIDKIDYLVAHAPKPALIITTTEDFFSIQGAREAFEELSAMYRALGHPDHVGMVEDGGPHASTAKNREAMYAFFQKHLSLPGNPADEEVELLSEDEVMVTSTGQLATSLGGETIYTLSREQARKQLAELELSRLHPDRHLPDAVQAARELSGFSDPGNIHKTGGIGATGNIPNKGSIGAQENIPGRETIRNPVFTGRIAREGYVIEKYFIQGEGDYVIPYLLFVPERPNHKALLYLHPSGKSAEAHEDGEMGWFAKNGFTVLAPDLIGTGETGPGELRNYSMQILDFEPASFDVWVASVMIGQSITGIRTAEAVRLTRLLQQLHSIERVFGVARGDMATVLLHAAAFEPSLEQVALLRPYLSYRSIMMTRYYDPNFHISTVTGTLKRYDLPDLAASLAPRRLLVAGPTDASGACRDDEGIGQDRAVIIRAYEHHSASHFLQITSCEISEIDLRNSLLEHWRD